MSAKLNPKLVPPLTPDALQALANSGVGARLTDPILSAIGDSRVFDMLAAVNTRRLGGRSWINWANSYMKKAMTILGCYGIPNNRSDQFLAESNFSLILNDASNIAVIGYPFVNDIGGAFGGYTDVDGNAITLANVLDFAVPRLRNRVDRLRAAGKHVIVCAEPGSTTWVASQFAVLKEANIRLQSEFKNQIGMYYFNPRTTILSPTTTPNQLVFKPGMTTDGTHGTNKQGNVVGRLAADTVFSQIVQPRKGYGVDLDTATQLFPNTGFTTLTGGTLLNVTGSDPVPANCRVGAATGGIVSYTLTSAPAPDGSGNEITLTLTASAAVAAHFTLSGVNVGASSYTSEWVGGMDIDVVSSDDAKIYLDTQIFSNQGTETAYDLYCAADDVWVAGGATGPMRLQNLPSDPVAGATTGLAVTTRIACDFSAAGSAVMKLKDPAIFRV